MIFYILKFFRPFVTSFLLLLFIICGLVILLFTALWNYKIVISSWKQVTPKPIRSLYRDLDSELWS